MHQHMDHQDIVNSLIGIVGAVVAWAVSIMSKRIDSIETKQDELLERITDTEISHAKVCVRSEELRSMRSEIFKKLDTIERKLDDD